VQLTIEQSAQLTHTDSTYVWEGSQLSASQLSLAWNGLIPLLGTRPKRAAPAPVTPISDEEALAAIVARIGVDHALNVIVKAERVAIAA
jgi:hypothetical protein